MRTDFPLFRTVFLLRDRETQKYVGKYRDSNEGGSVAMFTSESVARKEAEYIMSTDYGRYLDLEVIGVGDHMCVCYKEELTEYGKKNLESHLNHLKHLYTSL